MRHSGDLRGGVENEEEWGGEWGKGGGWRVRQGDGQ